VAHVGNDADDLGVPIRRVQPLAQWLFTRKILLCKLFRHHGNSAGLLRVPLSERAAFQQMNTHRAEVVITDHPKSGGVMSWLTGDLALLVIIDTTQWNRGRRRRTHNARQRFDAVNHSLEECPFSGVSRLANGESRKPMDYQWFRACLQTTIERR
jgi:hypothetical protein